MVKKFIFLLILQVVLLISMAISHYAVEWYGEEVHLQTAPVDPIDLFYGEYVILNYEISDIDISKFKGDQKPEDGDTVYVLLKKEGDYHQLVSAHLEKPKASSGEQVVKGKVEYITNRWDPIQREGTSVESVHVIYGFERYFVTEGTGKELEQKRGQFDVIVKVAPWGQNLSDLKFIANDVITETEMRERVYKYFENQSIPMDIRRSQLVSQYENQDRPVWLVEIMIYSTKGNEKSASSSTIVVDAKTGEMMKDVEAR